MATNRFTQDHEWIQLDGEIATIGITDYAQEQLGDVVFVELPEPGRTLARGDEAAVIESVKAAAEVYAPIDGTVTAINEALIDNPALVNTSAMTDGWFIKLTIGDAGQLDALMDEAAYKTYIEGLG